MGPIAVLVLVAGLLLVALIAGVALLVQRRRVPGPAPAQRAWPPAHNPPPGHIPPPGPTGPADPITTRTAREDPPTMISAIEPSDHDDTATQDQVTHRLRGQAPPGEPGVVAGPAGPGRRPMPPLGEVRPGDAGVLPGQDPARPRNQRGPG